MRIALLLLIRHLCLKIGVVVLTSDFCKGAERELLPGGCDSQRRISPLEAAVNSACVSWHALGVTPLWGPSGEPHGGKWPGCRGFVMLPESQNLWIIMRHGSVDMKPSEIGRKPTDQA